LNLAVEHGPVFSTLLASGFAVGETLRAQPDSMLSMTPGFEVKADLGGAMSSRKGALGGFRSLLGGESAFTANFTAKREGMELRLAPDQLGEIRLLEVSEGAQWSLASGCFLACETPVTLDLKFIGVRGFLATNGLFVLDTKGQGRVAIASHGAVLERTLGPGEQYVIDNRYLVAYSTGITFEAVTLSRSLRDAYFSGEGLVSRYTGPGTLLYQSRGRPSRGWWQTIFQSVF